MSSNLKNICAVIPIGGQGSRLIEITGNIPKPLFPIYGKTTLERCCYQIKKNGIEKIIITIANNSKFCLDYTKKLEQKLDISIETFVEPKPMGECGALWKLKNFLTDKFIFINGDLIFSIAFDKLINFHNQIDSELTLVTHITDHAHDSDMVSSPNGSYVEQISLKDKPIKEINNLYLGNAGIALINKKLLDEISAPSNLTKSSIFNHLVDKSFDAGIRIYSYNTSEYIKDMGTKDRFIKVEEDLKNNIVETKNYSNKQKVLFLDRDNTLIYCKKGEYILNASQIKFIEANIKKIAKESKKYNFVCLVTNQPQISMGLISYKDLDAIHSKLLKYCLKFNLKIDVITFCPHHPHIGFLSEVKLLKKDCFCRKPKPGMILEQAFLRNIDLKNSLFIGDSIADRDAALNAGVNFKNVNNILQ